MAVAGSANGASLEIRAVGMMVRRANLGVRACPLDVGILIPASLSDGLAVQSMPLVPGGEREWLRRGR